MALQNHLSSKLVARLADGKLTRAEAAKTLLHLQRCRLCYIAFQEEHPTQSEALWKRLLDDLYQPTLRENRSLSGYVNALEAEARAAKTALKKLRAKPCEKRYLLVANTPGCWSLTGVQFLLEEARDQWQKSPRLAVHWSELALAAMDAIPLDRYPVSLRSDYTARAWAYLGNATRLCSDLSRAEVLLKRATFWLSLGTQEPLERAMVYRLEAVLARDQRRFSIALEKGSQALGLYREVGDTAQAAWMEVALGITHLYQEKFTVAAENLEAFLRHYTLGDVGAKIYAAALHNAALALLECGCVQQAADRLREARRLGGQEVGILVEARFNWLEARILSAKDRAAAAESLFRQVQATFLLKAAPFDAALVTLDLTELLLRRGATREVKQLAADMTAIFLERDIHREARKAGLLLGRALLKEEATVNLVKSVARYLKLARNDPSYRFSPEE